MNKGCTFTRPKHLIRIQLFYCDVQSSSVCCEWSKLSKLYMTVKPKTIWAQTTFTMTLVMCDLQTVPAESKLARKQWHHWPLMSVENIKHVETDLWENNWKWLGRTVVMHVPSWKLNTLVLSSTETFYFVIAIFKPLVEKTSCHQMLLRCWEQIPSNERETIRLCMSFIICIITRTKGFWK